jgi:hypothetical protein
MGNELTDGATSNAVANRRETKYSRSFAISISTSAGRGGSSNGAHEDGRLPPKCSHTGGRVIQKSMAWLEWRPVLRSLCSTAHISNNQFVELCCRQAELTCRPRTLFCFVGTPSPPQETWTFEIPFVSCLHSGTRTRSRPALTGEGAGGAFSRGTRRSSTPSRCGHGCHSRPDLLAWFGRWSSVVIL